MNSIFPSLARSMPSSHEALLEGDCLVLRGALRGKSVAGVKALVGKGCKRIELSELQTFDGAGFALLVSLGLEGATWVRPPGPLRELLAKTRLFEVLEVEYE